MSSDPFADLASTVDRVAVGLRGLLKANQRPAAGSPAARDAVSTGLAGDWGEYPARDLHGAGPDGLDIR